MAESGRKGIQTRDYEIVTDADYWILRTWSATKPKGKHPLKTRERYCDRFNRTLQATTEKVADLEARKLVETVGAELAGLGKAQGEKLAALEDEVRTQCERARHDRAV